MNRLDQLYKLLEAEPKNSFVNFALAKEYENLIDYTNAIKYYTQLREADPDYIGLYYHLGKVYEKVDNVEKAKEAYQTGISKAQSYNDLHAMSELKGALMNLEISNL